MIELIRKNSWIVKITLMSAALGMLLAVAWKTQVRAKVNNIGTTRMPELVAAYGGIRKDNEDLREEINEQRKKITEYENQIANGSNATEGLNKELQNAKLLAGLVEAQGPGVVVTLRDSSRKDPEVLQIAPELDLSVIHDSDIRIVVNELASSGAEAMSVNDQRIVGTSGIRCAGPVILVNGTDVAPPYEIKAVGDPKTLESALRMPRGVVDSFMDPSMIDIRQDQKLLIKAYSGNRQFKWAKPVR